MSNTAARVKPLPRLGAPQGAASVHLDALRGIAAIGVCLSHVRDIFFRDYSQLSHHNPLLAFAYLATGLGHQWVIIFFVLSGYLVGGSALRSHATGRWTWNGYLFNRLTRLYIVLLPALILGGLLDVAGLHFFGATRIYAGNSGSHAINFAVESNLGIGTLLGNYAFLQGIFVPTLGSNGPLWSLTNEFWYYIAFPALLLALAPQVKLPRRLLHFALLISVLVLVQPSIALLGLVWLMGVVLHYLPGIPAKTAVSRKLLIWASLVLFAAALAWCKVARVSWSDYVLGSVVMVLLHVLLCCSRGTLPDSYGRVAKRLSQSSYTVYLAHVPLLVFIAAWFEARFHQSRWLPDAPHVLIGVALFAVVMLYAQAVWFLFEKRTDNLRAWLKFALRPGSRRVAASPDQPQ